LLTIVYELKNNTVNVRLKEKDSDFYLNDQIIAKLLASKVHAPVEQITQQDLAVSNPSMQILTPRYA